VGSAAGPAAGVGGLALAAAALPLITRDSYYLDVATTILMNLTLTMSFRLQISTGQINMAHISFMGIGAYASALLVTRVGLSFWATLWIGALVAALLAVPIGSVALRVSGPYYFLITFAFSEVVRLFFNNFFEGLFGGPSGLVGIPGLGASRARCPDLSTSSPSAFPGSLVRSSPPSPWLRFPPTPSSIAGAASAS